MNRKEEILNAAYKCYVPFSDKCSGFIKGAKWSDKHPSEDNIVAYLSTRVVDVPDSEEAMQAWIERAAKWLENYLCVNRGETKYYTDMIVAEFKNSMKEK